MTAAREIVTLPANNTGDLEIHYRQLFEQSPVASLLVSRDGTILEFNHRAADLLLIDPEMRSKPDLPGLVQAEDQNALASFLLAVFSDQKPQNLDIKLLITDGQLIPVRLASMPIADNPDICQISVLNPEGRPRNMKILSHLAYYDHLTGLPNRLLFTDRLRWAIRDARRQNEHLAVMMIDLDNFKQVNDTLGHDAGDLLLRTVAENMTACLRESDTLSRLGGDEFTILMQHVSSGEDAATAAERLLEAIRKPVALMDRSHAAQASIGICLYPDDGDAADTLIRNADIAMYRSKACGGNRVSFFNESMRAAASKQSKMEHELRQALQAGTLTVYYQPLVNAVNCRIIGLEALLRWQSDDDGILPAGQFLQLANSLGLCGVFSDWALLQACRQMKNWLDRGLINNPQSCRMAVNICAEQLERADLPDRINASLTEAGLPPGHLAIEITEDTVRQSSPEMLNNLQQLRDLGVALHIDNFSQGFSSLQKINSVHFDLLKIGQNFTGPNMDSKQSETLLTALVDLSHNLGLRVIAGGVENQQAYAWLRAHACDGMQGYYFCRPLPAIEIEMLLGLPQSS